MHSVQRPHGGAALGGGLVLLLLSARFTAALPCVFTDAGAGVQFDLSQLRTESSNYVSAVTESGAPAGFVAANVCGPLVSGAAGGPACAAPAAAAVLTVLSTAGSPPCAGTVGGRASGSDVANAVNWRVMDPLTPTAGLVVSYADGDACPTATGVKRTVALSFKCMAGATTLVSATVDSSCHYALMFTSSGACGTTLTPPTPSTPLGGGAIFVIVCVVVIFLYISVGVVYKTRTRGTSGMESIPNIDFWRDVGNGIRSCLRRVGGRGSGEHALMANEGGSGARPLGPTDI